MPRKEVPEIWVSRINDYKAKAKDELAPAWCERNQVSQDQLYYWMDKRKRANQQLLSASKPQFVPIRLTEAEVDVAPRVAVTGGDVESRVAILVRVGPATVEVNSGFDASLFAEVIRVLKSLC